MNEPGFHHSMWQFYKNFNTEQSITHDDVAVQDVRLLRLRNTHWVHHLILNFEAWQHHHKNNIVECSHPMQQDNCLVVRPQLCSHAMMTKEMLRYNLDSYEPVSEKGVLCVMMCWLLKKQQAVQWPSTINQSSVMDLQKDPWVWRNLVGLCPDICEIEASLLLISFLIYRMSWSEFGFVALHSSTTCTPSQRLGHSRTGLHSAMLSPGSSQSQPCHHSQSPQ